MANRFPEKSRVLHDKIFFVLLFVLGIELVFFKFIPDLGTASLPHQGPSQLADLTAYKSYYLTPGTVVYPRFLATMVHFHLAELLSKYIHSNDIRLNPLRIAAALLTPIYGIVGLLPVLIGRTRYNWRIYMALYCSYCTISLYVFYPFDMPSFALLSIAMFFVIEERLGAALIVMLVAGLVRESSLHIVWLVLCWAICRRYVSVSRRSMWVCIFAGAFTIEYLIIRSIFTSQGRLTSGGFFVLNPHELFFGRGLWSLTCIVVLAIVFIVPVYYLATRGSRFSGDWRHNLFVLNCAVTPLWIIFYRIMNGNISELRMLVPILLPIFYGLAMEPEAGPRRSSQPASPVQIEWTTLK